MPSIHAYDENGGFNSCSSYNERNHATNIPLDATACDNVVSGLYGNVDLWDLWMF